MLNEVARRTLFNVGANSRRCSHALPRQFDDPQKISPLVAENTRQHQCEQSQNVSLVKVLVAREAGRVRLVYVHA